MKNHTPTIDAQHLFSEKATRSLNEFEFLQDPKNKNAKLGKGSFASVKLVREKKTQKLFALKIINMNPLKMTRSEVQALQGEVQIHRLLDHPNIIKFHGHIMDSLNFYLVLDYAENGTLYDYLHKKKVLTPGEVFRYFHQTCLAIQYLHENNVLHRDLKPENLLLDKSLNIKLCDFGWAARSIKEKKNTFCGTYEYMAPEIVYKKSYDYRVDIWSLGILLYELIHREAPFKGRSLVEIATSLSKNKLSFSATIEPEVKDLITKILHINPDKRISIAEIIRHPWMQYHLNKQELQSFVAQSPILNNFISNQTFVDRSACASPIPNQMPLSDLKAAKKGLSAIKETDTSANYRQDTEPEVAEEQCHIQKSFSPLNIKCTRIFENDSALASPLTPMTTRAVNELKQNHNQYANSPSIDPGLAPRLYNSPSSATLTNKGVDYLIPKIFHSPSSATLNKAGGYETESKKPSHDNVKRKLFAADVMSPDFQQKVAQITVNTMNKFTPATARNQVQVGNTYFFSNKTQNHKKTHSNAPDLNTDRSYQIPTTEKSSRNYLNENTFYIQQSNQEQLLTNRSIMQEPPVLEESFVRKQSATPVPFVTGAFVDTTKLRNNFIDNHNKKHISTKSQHSLLKPSTFAIDVISRATPEPIQNHAYTSRYANCATPTPMSHKLYEESPNPKHYNVPLESVKSFSYKKSRTDDKMSASPSPFATEKMKAQKEKSFYNFDIRENLDMLKEINESMCDRMPMDNMSGAKTERKPVMVNKMYTHR